MDLSSSPFVGFGNSSISRKSVNISVEELNNKISETVARAVADSQDRFQTQMMGMLTNMLSNMGLDKPKSDDPPAPRNSLSRGAVPRTYTSASTNPSAANDPNRIHRSQSNDPGRQHFNSGNGNVKTLDIQKWNIRFEKITAKEFLNCIKIQWDVSGFTWEQVYYNFHHFLPGQSEKRWFYQYLQSNGNATWVEFSRAFNRRFGTYETDRQILTRMDQRKQGNEEPFLEFLEAMERLNASLEAPKREPELIEFLRDNVSRYMRPYIWMKYSNNLEEFTELCVEAENQIRKDKYRYNYNNKVNEIEETEGAFNEFGLAAIGKPQYFKRDVATVECWNCDLKGNFSRDCPSETRVIHCFRCGLKGATTPTCDNCKGNYKRMSN